MTSFKKKTDNTVFVRFVPPLLNRFQLEQHFSNIGPIKKCSVIRRNNDNSEDYNNNNKTLGYGFVKFVSKQDAETAAQTQNNSTFVDDSTGQSYKLYCELASSDNNKDKNKGGVSTTKTTSTKTNEKQSSSLSSEEKHNDLDTKQQQQQQQNQKAGDENDDYLVLAKRKRYNRVIIRNLSFYANEHHLRQVLEREYGPIVEVTIPKVGTTHRGFGFVTFEKPHHAQKAVDATAPLLIKKRPVAIDFSTPKLLHQRMKKEQQQQQHEDHDEEEEEEENKQNDGDNDNNDSDASSTNSDSGGDDSDDNDNSDSDSDSTASDSEEEEEDDDVESDAKQQIVDETSVSKGCTLFLRNLPFDATRHDVFTTFAKFGYITSAYLVKDRETGVAKGTAFVTFQKDASAKKALDAAGSIESGDGGAFVTQKDNHGMGEGKGLYLSGRRLLVDMAVTKETAATLTAEKQETKQAGKDKRNLYLKMEGRVANLADNPSTADGQNSAWENLPESDQLKRQRAFAEKNTKLRSPLFFINPHRLSIRNLAKHIDESQLKKLLVSATIRGLEQNLVSQDDQIAHWRAGGEMTHREIMHRIKEAAAHDSESDPVIPSFDEKNVKQFIPSLYIDRDFTTNKKEKAPSRGFGFVEFTHHAHALACLRELNNNPFYSEEYTTGGKKASDMKKNSKRKKRKGGGSADPKVGGSGGDFVGEDGRIKTPRLIVEFTVENKAKAKKQAEHKAQQQANIIKQKLEHKAKKKSEESDKKTESKKSRGQKQRERKRKQRESGGEDSAMVTDDKETSNKSVVVDKESKKREMQQKKMMKSVKPPKKQRKVDKEEQDFEQMVRKYTAAFEGASTKTVEPAVNKALTKSSKKRWYD